ncbi:MAG: glutathione synthase [Gammaproteobacteria bacterium]
MRLLFIIDAPKRLKPRKDSTIALMRAAARAGDEIFDAEISGLSMDMKGAAVLARRVNISESDDAWREILDAKTRRENEFDAVFMRAEPPVDARFAAATLLLDAFSPPVFNAPRALRERNEKLSIFQFPNHIPPTIVSADAAEIAAFHAAHNGAVIKPLDGMGGQGVYVSPRGDMNLRAVVEMQGGGRDLLMAQQYLPAAREGDARVFVIDGKPLPHMLVRVPRADDHRGNMAAGGKPEAKPLSAAAKNIAEDIGPAIAVEGVLFAGLDIIGGKLTEINITCPTGLREVRDQTGDDFAETILHAARARLA